MKYSELSDNELLDLDKAGFISFDDMSSLDQNIPSDVLEALGYSSDEILTRQNTAEKDALNITNYTIDEPKTIDDPVELRRGIQNKYGLTEQQAREYVSLLPGQAREALKGNEFAPLATIGDMFTTGGDLLLGLLQNDEPLLESMARIDPNPYTSTGEPKGMLRYVGESILKSPSTYATMPLGGFIGQGVSKVLPAFFKTGTRMANVGNKAAQGVGQTVADIAFDESTRPDELGNISGMNLGLSLLGGGALGAAAGGIAKTGRAAGEPKPFTAKTGGEAREQLDQQFLDATGLSKREMAALPREVQGVFKDITPEDKSLLDNFMVTAEKAATDPRLETPFEVVGRKWLKGQELLDNARKDAGKVMGEIEDQYLNKSTIPSEEVWDAWNKQLNEIGLEIAGEPGEIYLKELPGSVIGETEILDLKKITDVLNKMDDNVSPKYLRNLEKFIRRNEKEVSSSRSGYVPEYLSTAGTNFKQKMKDIVYKEILDVADESTLESYKQARKNYRKYNINLDEVQRKLGRQLEIDGEPATSRGAIFSKSMINRATNQTSMPIAKLIKELDPSIDLTKESIMADIAMKASKTPRGGKSFNARDMSKAGLTEATIDKGAEILGLQPQKFDAPMLGDLAGKALSNKSGQAPMYNNALDYIPQFTTYGARPAQKEIGEFIFPYTQDEEL